jgi:quercetin dioxygenase-like cupin family protein
MAMSDTSTDSVEGRPEPDPMAGRIARWSEIRSQGTPVMFIDSVLPGHYRMNYAVVGDTASENPDFKPALTAPHGFQVGMFEAPPGNGPAWHTHTYVEMFMPLTGKWRFCYGLSAEDPNDLLGEAVLEPWDVISFPPGLWRRFDNVSDELAVGFAVLDPHDVFADKDPIWPSWLVEEAARFGLASDAAGRMIKPETFPQLEAEITALIRGQNG